MKLLQHSWSDMLVLDHIHQRMHNNLPDETTLHNGQKFDLLSLGLLGVPSLADSFNDITAKLQELKFDVSDYICIKFLLLLNPGLYLTLHSVLFWTSYFIAFFVFFQRFEEYRIGNTYKMVMNKCNVLCSNIRLRVTLRYRCVCFSIEMFCACT